MSKNETKKYNPKNMTSAEIRRSFLEFFEEQRHTIVPSASLVPGGDQTLLFTNAGMVQFKDVFLGTGSRPYTRAVDSQKCMRVAGKHNDLEDVGRDDTHHTFFEMLGNWSFGDYYKREAIDWAWMLLTDVWGLPKNKLWATCFEDELGEIPRDDEAAEHWYQQPGFERDHLLFFGREENFWEMAETGPCGPDSEIHLDRGPEFCDKKDVPGHVCQVNGDCQRYLELWNLVFIQYNRASPTDLEPLPSKHVDTGMGFERIVSVIQGVDSNYKTDLFTPILDTIQKLSGQKDVEREEHLTPYRVIADHGRAASFLIADGVVPGNVGRNYVCRMIIRRASRFGGKIGLDEPFLASVAETVVQEYGDFYPELTRNKAAILQTLTDEERRFHHTIDSGTAHLKDLLEVTRASGSDILSGERAFDLYATYGLPLEITRDIVRENDLEVDEDGFLEAMEAHRLASGAGNGMGHLVEEDVEVYLQTRKDLQSSGDLSAEGVDYDPYSLDSVEGKVLALIRDGKRIDTASTGDKVTVVLPATHFYVEAGGQVSDSGVIRSVGDPQWEIAIEDIRQPVGGLIVHYGTVVSGEPSEGDIARASLDGERRRDIMRNHTATHLLHAALRGVLGEHARQAGSLVAPDRLRFDFTHNEAMAAEEIAQVEQIVNDAILANHKLDIQFKSHKEAVREGAIALFGETYSDTVRTISIGDDERYSYELCGGTHVPETGMIGYFLITSEGSVASGIRRIEAITGRAAQALVQARLSTLNRMSARLITSPEDAEERLRTLLDEYDHLEREISRLRGQSALAHYQALQIEEHAGVPVLTGIIPNADVDSLRQLIDRFRSEHPGGVIVLASDRDNRPLLVAGVSKDLVGRGIHASELVKAAAKIVGGGGGGKPTMAQAGGKDVKKLPEALVIVPEWIRSNLS
jgi:alanyl-tRNA synthetase